MNAKEKIMGFLDKQGFYVVLALCLLVIGVTAIFTITQTEKNDAAMQGEENLEANYGGENMVLEEVTQSEETNGETQAQQVKIELGQPVTGEVITKCALDELIYNETLKQWATHEGIDIGCLLDAPVKSVLAGTVEDVKEDALMGVTVTISHENGYKSVYSNLAKNDETVKVGDKVTKGQEIGKVGKTAICEYEMEDHLHFEFIMNDKNVDPLVYIAGLKTKETTQKAE